MGRDPEEVERKRSVLCAFRAPALRSRLEEPLQASGYTTVPVGSALELIDAVVHERPDLVLLDARLGGGEDDGIGLLEAVRGAGAAGAEVPTVLFSGGEIATEIEARVRALGVHVYQASKIKPRELQALVERALAGDVGVPSEGELLSLCERLQAESPFTALGVAASAEPAEIEEAYTRLRRWLDPDALADASPELRRVAQTGYTRLESAYAKLRGPASREPCLQDPEGETEPVLERGGADPTLAAEQSYREGERRLDQQDWSGALESFQRAVELCPSKGQYRACVGWATYLVYGAEPSVLRDAIRHAKEGMRLAPNHFRPALILGRLYQFTNRLDLAMKALKRAVNLNPDSVEAVRELRILRMRQDRRPAKGILSRLLRR